jgi:outer membrane receptor protein involved in Fe transport
LPFRRTSIFLCALVVLFGWQSASAASGDDRVIEEVIVTGSYLKRSAENSPSPLSVVSSADIEDIGAADVTEIVQAMPWASGSQTRAATFQGEGADGRGSINLRNLGHGATLPLVNGKRHVPSWYNGRGNASTNINGLIPNIAIERIEVVKDGASALYGSDAIAGVVNFITKKDFEGFDFSYQFTTSDETNSGDTHNFEVMWGIQSDRGGIVASASVLDRAEINVQDNYDRYGGTTISSTGQPGRLVPIGGQTITWADNGLNPGQPVDGNALPRDPLGTSFGGADVNCEDAAALEEAGPLGNALSRCIYDYGPFFAIQAQEKLRKIHVDGYYDLTDQIEVYFELAANESEFDRLNSLNPNAPALTIPTEVNYVDANGVLQTAPNPGSVEDAFRRGIEPIEYANLTRLIGGTPSTPKRYRPLDTFTNSDRKDNRYVVGMNWDFEIAGKEWTMDLSYTASNHNSATTQSQDTLSSHMRLALSGLGGPNCDQVNGVPGDGNAAYVTSGGDFDAGQCYFFNPFGNNLFDRNGNLYDIGNQAAGDAALELINPPELYQWLLGNASSDLAYQQRVLDWVFAGDLFNLGDQPVGLAVGYQQRRDKGQQIFDSALTSDNLDFAYGADNWTGRLTTDAFFAELAVPIGDRFTANFAVRYEEFDEINEDTTDPKLTLLWQPLDGLSLRGSWGTSFRVPSLQQTFGALTTVANQVDLVGGTAFKPSITQGNPNLVPESAENWGVGFSWVPTDGFLEGFQIDLDYFHYDYDDIITRESSSTLIAEDNAALAAYAAANLGGSCATLNDCYIDGTTPGAGGVRPYEAFGGNPAQVVRNSQAIMIRLLPNFANANKATISGLDLNTSYTFDTGIGMWRLGLQAAWLEEYEVEVPNSAGGVTVFDAVGSYNSTNPVARPLPEWRINGTLNWSFNNHRVFLIVKYVDSLTSDIPAPTRGFFAIGARLAGNDDVADELGDTKIQSMTTADVQYSYSFGQTGWLQDSTVSLGIMNFTNEEAPPIAVVTAYDGTLHDGRGRMWYLRFKGSL